jgi:hypothetical protein
MQSYLSFAPFVDAGFRASQRRGPARWQEEECTRLAAEFPPCYVLHRCWSPGSLTRFGEQAAFLFGEGPVAKGQLAAPKAKDC